jgi:hypothetical protein
VKLRDFPKELTRSRKERIAPSRSLSIPGTICPVVTDKKISSKMKGNTRAPAKGQPNRVPTANQKMPCAVLMPARQSMKVATPSIVVYMAKLEGTYAIDA